MSDRGNHQQNQRSRHAIIKDLTLLGLLESVIERLSWVPGILQGSTCRMIIQRHANDPDELARSHRFVDILKHAEIQ
jgi:hypothetical protein